LFRNAYCVAEEADVQASSSGRAHHHRQPKMRNAIQNFEKFFRPLPKKAQEMLAVNVGALAALRNLETNEIFHSQQKDHSCRITFRDHRIGVQ
jgi:hypothetical protein